MELNIHSELPEMEVQRLYNLRQTYEIQSQTFSHLHDHVVIVILSVCILFVLLGHLWVSVCVLLNGSLIIYLARKRILSLKRKISQIDYEMHELCLGLLA